MPAALATPLPPPDAVRARFEPAGLPWMGIDIETHCLVPSTADNYWRPGQFGFMTRLTKEVLAELRVVQIGWTVGTFGSAPTTKERLVQPAASKSATLRRRSTEYRTTSQLLMAHPLWAVCASCSMTFLR